MTFSNWSLGLLGAKYMSYSIVGSLVCVSSVFLYQLFGGFRGLTLGGCFVRRRVTSVILDDVILLNSLTCFMKMTNIVKSLIDFLLCVTLGLSPDQK